MNLTRIKRANAVALSRRGEGSMSAFEASAEPNHIPTIDDQNPIHV
jgi:hypothetical protein